ncbi:MAG: hypothetical protein ABIG42_02905 [bacterium]
MSQQTIRLEVIAELQAGRLGMAMKLVEDNTVEIDDELRNEAVKACMDSLKRHFHWIIPAFVQAFGIKDDPRLNQLAAKIIALALQHGQPLIADLAARTFGIQFDENIKRVIESAKVNMIRSIEQAQAVVIQPESGEYNFELE